MSTNIENEEDRTLAVVLTTLIWALWGVYLFVIITGIFFYDRVLIALTLAGCALLGIPMVLLKRHHLRTASLVITLIELSTVTIIATVGQGIRDLALVTFPIIFIFAGLALERKYFLICVGLALVAVCWLVFGETFGWFVTKPFQGGATNWFYLLGVTLILLVAALAVDLLASYMRKSLERTRAEVVQRKQAEEALRESEARLKEAQILGKIGNWEFDLAEQSIEWSDETYRLYERDPAMGPPSVEEEAAYYSPEEAKRLGEYSRSAIEQVRTFEYDLEARLPSGKTAIFTTTMHPVQDATGRIVKLFGTVQDITKQKQAEIALAEEHNLLVTLMDNLPDMIYFKDTQSRIIRSNRAHARRVGLTDPDQMIGKTDFDLFGEEHARAAYEDEQQIIHLGQPLLDKEEKEIFQDGHALWVSTTKMPLRDQQGRIVGTFGISRDITERKRVEEALRESEDRYRRLVETLPIGVIIHSQGRVLFANLASAKISGATNPAELIGKPVIKFLHPDHREIILKRIQQSFSENVPNPTMEEKFIRFDGTPIDVQVTTIPFSEAGEPAMLSAFNDITARKQVEKLQDAIYRISQAADHAQSLESLYPSIHAIIQEVMVADNFYIALYDGKNDLLSFPYSVDERDSHFPPRKPAKGLTEYVLRTGRTVLCDEALYQGLIQRAEIQLVGAHSPIWLGVPLIVEDKVIGVMAVQDYKNDQAYGERELRILEFVSSQVAQVIVRKRLEEEIRSLSLTDELTGLFNRRGFTLLAEQEVRLAHRMKRAMLLFFGDVDNLKTINDTLGHAQGDLALQEISAILKENFRESDILARLGGDEFVVLAVDASKENAEIITNRIQAALKARNQQGGKTYHLTLSLGVARYDPEAPCTVSELMTQADGLMYHQKQARK
jgi:diguanylate cyclase (GGDEF)-like protein/PAS domain S-box-containing protein